MTVIDGATNDTTTVAAGTHPRAVAVNPVTNKIYVANYGSNNVTVIDGATNATTTVAAGTSPYAVAVNPVTNKIYVANYGSDNVTVIDGATNATTTVAAGTNPCAVAVNPVTNKIYVANHGSDNVTVIDGATNATTTVAAGTTPCAVAVNPVTNKIYVANYGSDNVTVIDGATNATTTVAAGTNPCAVAVNPVTNKIYVANYSSDNVTVLTEQAVSAIPLTTTISPLAGDISYSATPTFTLSAASAFAPTAPPVQGVFTQVDTWQGSWQAATPSAGVFTATTSTLGLGTHVLYAYAVDGQDGTGCSNGDGSTCSPLVGSIAAYVFTVVLPQADLSITKTDGATTEVPGTPVTYTIVASNAGPSNAPSVTVADTFPAHLHGSDLDLCGRGRRDLRGELDPATSATPPSLPVGGSATYTATCTISASATGSLSNTATATVGGGVTDPTPGNNSATDTDTLTPQADVSITKTDGATDGGAGDAGDLHDRRQQRRPLERTQRDGGGHVPGASARERPGPVRAPGGGTCAASGSGDISDTANLPVGGSATYTATCTISASATGSLSNTATATVGGGVTDPTPGNNSATDTDTLTPRRTSRSRRRTGHHGGAGDAGDLHRSSPATPVPSNAPSVTVADTFPAVCTGATWTCAGAGGGTCAALARATSATRRTCQSAAPRRTRPPVPSRPRRQAP